MSEKTKILSIQISPRKVTFLDLQKEGCSKNPNSQIPAVTRTLNKFSFPVFRRIALLHCLLRLLHVVALGFPFFAFLIPIKIMVYVCFGLILLACSGAFFLLRICLIFKLFQNKYYEPEMSRRILNANKMLEAFNLYLELQQIHDQQIYYENPLIIVDCFNIVPVNNEVEFEEPLLGYS